ncbi:hypothetical protein [Chryseolinea lacunae]|uniref:Uncharacterized protein n=1 Tax=Chryseolinea lacunae TaxID=2801331 RepID=A0ABS1L1H6_9BACT|nr:hypothetical protein [Chryseolinea lacunae]MBL0745388.1 hypothetical protein [Chryseolinea lacunae]
MATDGVKIIDGDTAHDTYWGIMDRYDGGADADTIAIEFPLDDTDTFDDFDHEIYVTSCALAYWELGLMTTARLQFVRQVIDKGAGVRDWESEDPSLGKARKRELERLWKKISQVNQKIRSRKKYRKVTNLCFADDDLLTFQHRDGSYRVVICSSVSNYRGVCSYTFAFTTYNAVRKPSINNVLTCDILGHQISSSIDPEQAKAAQPGIERIWKFVGTQHYVGFGLHLISIPHADLLTFKDKFENIGTLRIVSGLKWMGSLGGENSFEGLERHFDDQEKYIETFRAKKYPVTVLCEI